MVDIRMTAFAAAAVFAAAAGGAWAQGVYPTRPVTIVVPFSAGGTTDALARLLADDLRRTLGQSVVVENRTGAGGTIGSTHVARAQPDGYTLLLGALATHAVAPAVYSRIAYDAVKDFTPVSLVTVSPFVLTISAALPANNVAEFVTYARANPAKINYSSTGVGSASHLAGDLFARSGAFKATHIPYKGTPEAFGALIGGEATYFLGNLTPIVPHIRAGKLRGLAVTGNQRSAALPELPLIGDTGHPGANVIPWFGLFAPARTPEAIVNRLAAEIRVVLEKPEIRTRLIATGDEPAPMGPAEFAAMVKSDLERYAKIVRDAGVKAD
jgi:tripartite-type tricarboxylate transporter receptor subunit TctC